MGSKGKGLTAHQITGGRSLAEVKAMHAQQIEFGKRIDQIADYRKRELESTQQQLYTQVEDFRLNQHTELRREVEVSWDIAIRTVPWWSPKRWDLAYLRERAKEIAGIVKTETGLLHDEAMVEAQMRLAADKAKQEREAAEEKARQQKATMPAANQDLTVKEAAELQASEAVRPGNRNPADYGMQVENEAIHVGDLAAGEKKIIPLEDVKVDVKVYDDDAEPEEEIDLDDDTHEEAYANRSPETNVL